METQKTPNNQSNLEEEKQNWSNQSSCFHIKLQSYRNQDGTGTKL